MFKSIIPTIAILSSLISGCAVHNKNEIETAPVYGPSCTVYDRVSGELLFGAVYEPKYNYSLDNFEIIVYMNDIDDFSTYEFSANDILIECPSGVVIPGELKN